MNEQNNEPIQGSKNIWITLIIVAVTALIAGGAVYAWQESNLNKIEKNLQKQIITLQNQVNQFNQQIDQPQEIAREIVYKNSKYGFSLTFPQTWKGYATKSRTLNWGLFGTSDSVDFGFSVQDSLFNISVHSKKQWQQINSEEGPKPAYLGENSQYVFGYATAQYAANDTINARMAEIPDIVKTFKLQELISSDTMLNWQTYSDSKFSYKCPLDWTLGENKNYNGQVDLSECSKIYSGQLVLDDGVRITFGYVPQVVADNYFWAGQKWSETLINEVKNETNAQPYSNNNFIGWISMKNQKHTLSLIARYQVNGGYYEASAIAMGDSQTDQQYKQIIDEIISTFEAK